MVAVVLQISGASTAVVVLPAGTTRIERGWFSKKAM
jgi:hypothetical protein